MAEKNWDSFRSPGNVPQGKDVFNPLGDALAAQNMQDKMQRGEILSEDDWKRWDAACKKGRNWREMASECGMTFDFGDKW